MSIIRRVASGVAQSLARRGQLSASDDLLERLAVELGIEQVEYDSLQVAPHDLRAGDRIVETNEYVTDAVPSEEYEGYTAVKVDQHDGIVHIPSVHVETETEKATDVLISIERVKESTT